MSSLRNTKQQGGEVHWISHNQWQSDASSLVAIEASLRLRPHVLTSCVLSLMGWQENAATIRVTCRIFKIKLLFFFKKTILHIFIYLQYFPTIIIIIIIDKSEQCTTRTVLVCKNNTQRWFSECCQWLFGCYRANQYIWRLRGWFVWCTATCECAQNLARLLIKLEWRYISGEQIDANQRAWLERRTLGAFSLSEVMISSETLLPDGIWILNTHYRDLHFDPPPPPAPPLWMGSDNSNVWKCYSVHKNSAQKEAGCVCVCVIHHFRHHFNFETCHMCFLEFSNGRRLDKLRLKEFQDKKWIVFGWRWLQWRVSNVDFPLKGINKVKSVHFLLLTCGPPSLCLLTSLVLIGSVVGLDLDGCFATNWIVKRLGFPSRINKKNGIGEACRRLSRKFNVGEQSCQVFFFIVFFLPVFQTNTTSLSWFFDESLKLAAGWTGWWWEVGCVWGRRRTVAIPLSLERNVNFLLKKEKQNSAVSVLQ